jgi:arylsulfatase A-like enzyme
MKARFKLACAVLALLPVNQIMAQDRTILPVPPAPFAGTIAESVAQSKADPQRPISAPDGAPNVLLFMSDDVGFAMSSTFGGPVPTPNFDRLAAQGQRYNRFHTTGICSPSRAALLTGRNHHNAGVGYLSDLPVGFPGYGGKILPETATIAQVLKLNGYNTAMFGKHHNVTITERSEAGPFDTWPTGLGFEYFYGFVGGDSDQYTPNLYRGTSRVNPDEAKVPNGLPMLEKRLADDMIRWVHNQKASAPDKPFLVYWAPGSTHAPHQAPPEYITRFKGQFDGGWDKAREDSFRRQRAAGIIPKSTKLTARPDAIPAWDTLDAKQKAFAARSMEVAAAQLAYEDEQFGRVLDELERMGLLGNTLISLVAGDNGASGEAGPEGTINELRSIQTHDEDQAWLHANTERLGSPATYGNYPVGWAWAMNTPLRWTKQFGSMLGGIRNGMILSYPGHVAKPGATCGAFGHLNDLVPTILEAAGLPAPTSVLGVAQKPMDGQSLLGSLSNCDADKPRTQYFEIGGKMGLYHNGWFLSGDDGRPAWQMAASEKDAPKVQWTLYDLTKDFSQSTDLSLKNPQQLRLMLDLWQQEATRNNVFPLDARRPTERADRSILGKPRKHYDYWGKDVSIPASATAPFLAARNFTLEADLILDKAGASGAIIAWGSRFGGWSLYLDEGRPAFTWAKSTDPKEMALVQSTTALPQGATKLRLRFTTAGPGKGAEVVLSADGRELALGLLPSNYLSPAGGGETLDIGRDIGATVVDYKTPHGAIEGDVPHVVIDFD